MRIGLINPLHGAPGPEAPSWTQLSERARLAEEAGFDIFVFEDALMYRGESRTEGVWESMTIAGALAATTRTIEFGQSVVNSPYRAPALVASMATTLDEISGGRYVLGVGAGNTPVSDYRGFGFPTDRRFSRFAEWIEILHRLLRSGSVDFEGDFHSAQQGELPLRGPHREGPRLTIAAGGEKMLGLVAQFGDEWNWWCWDETFEQLSARLVPMMQKLEAACFDAGRDPGSLVRTLDLYSVALPGAESELQNPLTGSADEIAAMLLELRGLGFEEVRCDVLPRHPEAIEAMAPVVDLVHAG
jgi:alkanesulfonate monooxygenase SsuD/methylene tetrahydromethanopterin reductase-like flavin-dependent oxidoreductase (luciferase family)